MSKFSPEEFEVLLPLACAWAAEQERVILLSGVALTEGQLADARRVGVRSPDRVRLLRVAEIPSPDHPALAAAAEATGLISPFTIGLTLRYGILIRDDCWGRRRLVVHELAHTIQYERLGSIGAFLRRYLHECITIGYPEAPMEQEARRIERELCARHSGKVRSQGSGGHRRSAKTEVHRSCEDGGSERGLESAWL